MSLREGSLAAHAKFIHDGGPLAAVSTFADRCAAGVTGDDRYAQRIGTGGRRLPYPALPVSTLSQGLERVAEGQVRHLPSGMSPASVLAHVKAMFRRFCFSKKTY
jgi:hypothetical protein